MLAFDLSGSLYQKNEVRVLHGGFFLTRFTAARSGSGIVGETMMSVPLRFVRVRAGTGRWLAIMNIVVVLSAIDTRGARKMCRSRWR